MVSFSALAGMVTLEDDALSETRARTGITIDLPSARATATAIFLRDSDGAAASGPLTANTNAGYLILDTVRLSDTSGSGNIGLYGLTLDAGRVGTTSMVAIGIPSIVGRISINEVLIGNGVAPDYGAPAYGIYVQNVSVDAGSALWVWGH